MTVWIVLGTLLLPIIMLVAQWLVRPVRYLLDAVAIISAYIFGSVFAVILYTILRDGMIFMTTIHQIFTNPAILITGGYLGLYMIYRLMIGSLRRYQMDE